MTLTRSRPKLGVGYFGPIPEGVWKVIELAHGPGIATSSNTAREAAVDIALTASLGWISTVAQDGQTYTARWNATHEGVYALKHKETYGC